MVEKPSPPAARPSVLERLALFDPLARRALDTRRLDDLAALWRDALRPRP